MPGTRTQFYGAVTESAQTAADQDMSANKKLYGKDLSAYENMDMDELLDQLTPEEVDLLTRDVDPDDTLMPPCQRMSYRCDKKATGPLDRKKLIEHIHQQALNEPDRPEMVPYQPNTVRGKKWIPPPPPMQEQKLEEEIALDLGDEYETALGDASEGELVDLAAILGFHSMMNQDQYHASLLGKRLESEVGWAGITRASKLKAMAPEPPNMTDPEQSIERVKNDDAELLQLNLNNIKNMSDEQLERLCQAAAANTRLESLFLSNTGLTDRHAEHLVTMLEKNSCLRELSVESNFISPAMMARLSKAMLKNRTIEAFRAANQRSSVLGNKIEMEITKYIEENPTILQLGIHFEFNDSRARVSAQLQKNRDRLRVQRQTEGMSCCLSIQLPASKALSLGAAAGGAAADPDPGEETDDDQVEELEDSKEEEKAVTPRPVTPPPEEEEDVVKPPEPPAERISIHRRAEVFADRDAADVQE